MKQDDYVRSELSQQTHDNYIKNYEEICATGERKILVFIGELKPKFSKDGDMYCYLLGDNLQEGIAGFGEIPWKAALDLYNKFMGVSL
jgi:hypothetical protein